MKVRGIVGGFTTCAAHSFVFIVVKTYPLLCHGVVSTCVDDLYPITDFMKLLFLLTGKTRCFRNLWNHIICW